ncbi:MAG: HAMP domain-containing sensor histidine kinase [Eubacteriales bacterium]|nr:HAMP domain-containing sensor histidine kinase [Eubacteriales bacterium]
MKLLEDLEIRRLFLALSAVFTLSLLLAAGLSWLLFGRLFLCALLPLLSAAAGVWIVCLRYFRRQNETLAQAAAQIDAILAGDADVRIECDEEGGLYRLFHSVNALAAILGAHADKELREKEFLKNTISDISHQLKTPLAALSIYNGLLQDDSLEAASVREFAALSEQELDRMETLVQNLLKITRLDAGAIVPERSAEDAAGMMRDAALPFTYRAAQEQKNLILSGPEETVLFCDRSWLTEAVGNLIKNALDHTASGGTVRVEWEQLPCAVQITVRDDGCGIHPEDLYHIFKRFYRSRFSKDTPGLGLGLPLAKAIVEAHGGTIEADSSPGRGSSFTMFFPIPTKL